MVRKRPRRRAAGTGLTGKQKAQIAVAALAALAALPQLIWAIAVLVSALR